ncbi:Kelch repeat-containing protein [Adhaeribacter radiodurans]|uniref:T9SS type A sorting domain-containing protein n=1 Tax=Adhaeribacter radiodurans TaxID=2745197 RepID=A0A7L7L3F6_9BACT|nr:kelch repeat-containing protein [Adhaeribacter radiodurans]QMU27338.1 T9SS type A sorting domain-containing protein [Adhaeribacter radiodurans]
MNAKYFICFAFGLGLYFQGFAANKYSSESLEFLCPTFNPDFINKSKNGVLHHEKSWFSRKINFVAGPSFAGNYNLNIPENASIETILDTIQATDPDGDALIYSIQAGNTNTTFLLDSVSGTLKISKKLNYHTQSQYSLIVKVTDATGLFSETSVDIKVELLNAVPLQSSFIWETAASQPYVVNEAQGETVNNKLYNFGGFDSQKSGFTPTSRAYVYDPNLNKWTALAPLPPMNGTKYGGVTHTGITTDGTDIYFAGGYTSNLAGTGQIFGTKEVWKYIVAENRYERLLDLPIVVAAGQLEYVNGWLHHIGGTNQARTVDLNNHYALNLDDQSAGWKLLAPLPNPRQHAGSAVYEGKIYYIGGQTGHDKNLITQKKVHAYDPVTNQWTEKADLQVPAGSSGRGHISSAVLVAGNQILVLAGETVHSSGQSNLVSAYNPNTNTWGNLAPLPKARFSGVAALLNNCIYYSGGSRTNITFKSSPVLPPTQSLIQNLKSNTGGVYSFGELVVGTTIYTDQTYQIKSLPDDLNHSLFIKTPDKDKSLSEQEVFSFDITKGSTLYIAYDSKATVLPAWLNEWQKLPDTISTTNPIDDTYQLYSKSFPAGKVILSGNMATPAAGVNSNYYVIIVPNNTTGVQPEWKKEKSIVKLFPNPSSTGGKIKMFVSGLTPKMLLTITMQDMVGRRVYTQQVKTNQEGIINAELTPFPQLSKGLYLVTINFPLSKVQAKLLIE